MADIQTQLPVKLTDNTNTAAITAGSALRVDGSAVTQPISGTVTANAGTGNFNVVGTGTAGSASSGVVTIQGIASMTAVTVDSELPTAAALSDSTSNPTAPMVGAGTMVWNGTNWSRAKAFDTDSGGGNDYVIGVSLRKTASGGSVEAGTSTDPLRIDPTGTTTQPVSGTVTANAGTGNFNVVGTGTAGSAASGVVTVQGIASMTAIKVDGSAVTQPVSFGETSTGIVNSYSTQSSIANAAVGTCTYTVTVSKVFYLRQVLVSASGGPCKVVVDYGAGPTVLAVAFFSAAVPFVNITFAMPPAISASTAVNVKITNNAGASQDVYATISGHEVDA